jgi:hypothetical protein
MHSIEHVDLTDYSQEWIGTILIGDVLVDNAQRDQIPLVDSIKCLAFLGCLQSL